jgi:hypothetical protein
MYEGNTSIGKVNFLVFCYFVFPGQRYLTGDLNHIFLRENNIENGFIPC